MNGWLGYGFMEGAWYRLSCNLRFLVLVLLLMLILAAQSW
jgi:hypothetical protein